MTPNATNNVRLKEPGRILIVDDDPDFSASLVELMSQAGHDCAEAAGPHEATEMARSFRPQVALLGVRLGKWNGVDLVPRLKERHEETVCIMMTAFTEVESAARAIRFGADDYLQKPLSPDALLDRVNTALEPGPGHDRARAQRPHLSRHAVNDSERCVEARIALGRCELTGHHSSAGRSSVPTASRQTAPAETERNRYWDSGPGCPAGDRWIRGRRPCSDKRRRTPGSEYRPRRRSLRPAHRLRPA